MSTGPIEFERERNVDTLGETEYGGGPGLIQAGPNGEHLARLSTSERRGIMVRAQSSASDVVEVDEDGATTITRTIHAEGIDPVTELTLEDVDSEEVAGDSVAPVLPPAK